MIEGACHCGAVHWRLDTTPDSATACNCTLCRRYGALWAYGHAGEDIHATGPTNTYLWSTRSIGFHFCPTCGCVAWWRGTAPGKDGRRRAAVNLRMAEPDAVAAIPIHHFDGLNNAVRKPTGLVCVADLWA